MILSHLLIGQRFLKDLRLMQKSFTHGEGFVANEMRGYRSTCVTIAIQRKVAGLQQTVNLA
jgi:hypothetical protein